MNSRRTFMEGVAALAAANWADEEYDIEDAENWDPIEGNYLVGEFTPDWMVATGEGAIGGWGLYDEDLTDRTLVVEYVKSGVNVNIEGEAGDHRGGALATLTPDQAREVAAAIYQAAEELDRRPGGP